MNSKSTPTQKAAVDSTVPSPTVTMELQPYLFFEGHCEEAIDFYRRTLGAEVVMLLRYKESPGPPPAGTLPPDSGGKIMHANLRIGGATVLASDGRCRGRARFEGFALSLTVPTAADAERRFAALADGGRVEMPLTRTFFSRRFGMVADRFGISWMVYVAPAV